MMSVKVAIFPYVPLNGVSVVVVFKNSVRDPKLRKKIIPVENQSEIK